MLELIPSAVVVDLPVLFVTTMMRLLSKPTVASKYGAACNAHCACRALVTVSKEVYGFTFAVIAVQRVPQLIGLW